MLLAPQERPTSKKMELNRWKRLTKQLNPKPAFDPDSVEHWMKRVKKASEFAVSNAFYARNSDLPGRFWSQMDLGAFEQIKEHDEVYAEAQEMVNNWLDTKLKQELASDGEEDGTHAMSEANGHLKYDKFDDLYGYLEEEEESTTVQKFIDHLLHKEVVDSGTLEDLGMKENQDKKQQKDPRLTMEMRHKQVKENRLRREKELERLRTERALKKSAFLEAQYLVQEEKRKKALKAKKEKEEIQKEMVKLRREILDRRRTVEEAWKLEKKNQEENSSDSPETSTFHSAHTILDKEKVERERKRRLKEILIQTYKENHQCQKRYFSAWHKLILDHRIQLGKAGALSDWKLQLKVLRAWRDHTRSQKLERETQAVENHLREENRKQQLATEYNRKQVLRRCFAEWQHWRGALVMKRDLARAKEETRKKMDELLKAASLGKLSTSGLPDIHPQEEATAMVGLPVGSGKVTAGLRSPLWEKPPLGTSGSMLHPPLGRSTKDNLQDPFQHIRGSCPDIQQHKTLDVEISQQPGGDEKPGTSSQEEEPVCLGHFRSRHVYQQRLIEKQKKKLEEQQKTILELKESQRLAEARWAAERAAAVTHAQRRRLSNPRGAEEPKGTCQKLLNSSVISPGTEDSRNDSRSSLSEPQKTTKQTIAPHPILKAMEERAVQRAERRRILAERKKKQDEEKLAQLKAQEEERQKKEAEEKEAQLQRKREEKRLKKMKELEKQKRIKRNRELEAVAKEHYKIVLLRKKGLEPWKRLRMQSKQNIQYVTELEEEIRKLSANFLLKKILRAWFTTMWEAKMDSQSKHEAAVAHYHRKILSNTFQTWQEFRKCMKEERVKEERREKLRRKVAEILPDFQMLTPS
ncbi:coiled-coil domain-containing protein 191 isoform X2 [Perognathus longimembris pacificus]|uniref:coiled-coil domain-containing protein 191 isoform X2 n=1 Tax=Perognathus longimembris pacificus TaxID=214514 RepID=UPI0020186853|nr:coiled-coil domain-containing protein 191 isoform X2 [Perognathus longimembris pacificus]